MLFVFLPIIIVQALIILFFIIFTLLERSSIRSILDSADKIANKDVETEDIKISGSRQVKRLAECVNTIKKNLLTFIESTKGNVIVLSDAIDILSKATKANEIGSEQTAESICVVAEKATEQLDLVRDNLELIEANNKQLDIIDKSMQTIKSTLNDSAGRCNAGMSSLEKYEADMRNIEENLDLSMKILQEFNAQIKEVNSIGELVVEVSEELKLLAFNASIEAARAGEAGKGFAVVSQEMSVMSEKTKESMDAINDILSKVMDSSGLVNESISKCSTTFNTSAAIFGEVSKSFRTISDQSYTVNDMMNDMTAKYEVIAKNSDISKEKAENVFSASGTISDSTRDIVAVSQETSAESTQMSENVAALENMLVSIRKLIKQFKTGVTPSEKNRSERVKIAFFSKLDNYFWYAIRRGVLYAQKELAQNNVDIIYKYYVDDITEQAFPSDVQQCIDDKVDAIIYPGFLDKANKELKAAAGKGIKIFTYNCDCGKDINRISCYEPDQEEAGIMAANAIAKAINRSGNVAIVVGDRAAMLNRIRYDSFVGRIQSAYKDIHIVDTVEVTYNPEKTYKQVVEMIQKNPGISAIYSTTGMQIQLAKAIEDTGNKGRIKAVVFDQNDEIFEYIRKGVIAAAIDHDPFSQGHDPIILMYNHIVDGLVLPKDRVKCKASVVDSDNIKERISVE